MYMNIHMSTHFTCSTVQSRSFQNSTDFAENYVVYRSVMISIFKILISQTLKKNMRIIPKVQTEHLLQTQRAHPYQKPGKDGT